MDSPIISHKLFTDPTPSFFNSSPAHFRYVPSGLYLHIPGLWQGTTLLHTAWGLMPKPTEKQRSMQLTNKSRSQYLNTNCCWWTLCKKSSTRQISSQRRQCTLAANWFWPRQLAIEVWLSNVCAVLRNLVCTTFMEVLTATYRTAV